MAMASPPAARAIKAMLDARKALLDLERDLAGSPPTPIRMRQLAEVGATLHQLLSRMAIYL